MTHLFVWVNTEWSQKRREGTKIRSGPLPVLTRVAPKCSATTLRCASTSTRTVHGCTYVPSAARPSSSRPSSSAISWCTRAKSRSSARSKAAGSDFRSTLTWEPTCESIQVTGPTFAPLTGAIRSLPSPPTSSRTSSPTPKQSKTRNYIIPENVLVN